MSWKQFCLAACTAVILFSCVSSKKFKKSQSDYAALQAQHTQLQNQLQETTTNCTNDKAELNRKNSKLENDVANLNNQVEALKQNNTQALKQLQDMSVISASQQKASKNLWII